VGQRRSRKRRTCFRRCGCQSQLAVISAIPTLTKIQFVPGLGYTHYAANPGWQYNAAGWYSYPEFYLRQKPGSDPLDANQLHDCLNGQCIPAKSYKTPGVFANLAACQSGCAKNSNCKGECVSAAEIAALQQAANNVRPKLCK
jgi:hypothetical protein